MNIMWSRGSTNISGDLHAHISLFNSYGPTPLHYLTALFVKLTTLQLLSSAMELVKAGLTLFKRVEAQVPKREEHRELKLHCCAILHLTPLGPTPSLLGNVPDAL